MTSVQVRSVLSRFQSTQFGVSRCVCPAGRRGHEECITTSLWCSPRCDTLRVRVLACEAEVTVVAAKTQPTRPPKADLIKHFYLSSSRWVSNSKHAPTHLALIHNLVFSPFCRLIPSFNFKYLIQILFPLTATQQEISEGVFAHYFPNWKLTLLSYIHYNIFKIIMINILIYIDENSNPFAYLYIKKQF